MAKINIDLTNIKAEGGSMFSKVPVGTYLVSVAHTEFKDGKNGASGLQVGYMVESGEHKGKMIQDYINIVNSNEKAVEMGLGRLRRICDLQLRKSFKLVNDTDLINREIFSVDVEIEESEYQGKTVENNKVKKLYALDTKKAEVNFSAPAATKEENKAIEKAVKLLPWE